MPKPRGRLRNAPRVEIQPTDINAFLILHHCDGLMSGEQLVQHCYPGKGKENTNKRLLALFDNKYLNRNWEEEKWNAFPHLVYWLVGKGYDEVYSFYADRGKEVSHNTRNIHVSAWKPMTLQHHLEVNDIFLKMLVDLKPHPQLELRSWVGDAYFRSKQWKGMKPWYGKVRIENKNGRMESKEVNPDGFFKIIRWSDKEKTKPLIRGYALEVDRGFETQQSIKGSKRVTIEEKLKKGAALVNGSPQLRHVFRLGNARCLMVTKSWPRAENMMEIAQEAGVAWAWYFTTHDVANDSTTNILTDEIWRKTGEPQPVRLVDEV